MAMTDPAPAHDKPKGGRLVQLGEGILHALRDLNGVLTSLRSFLADPAPKQRLPGRRSQPVATANPRAQRVRIARQAQGMSIAKLARKVGASDHAVARYERGTISFSKFERQIFAVLGLREEDLAADAESAVRPMVPAARGAEPRNDADDGRSAAPELHTHAESGDKELGAQEAVAERKVEAEAASSDATLKKLRRRAFTIATDPAQAQAKGKRYVYHRSKVVRRYVLARADGNCEGCSTPAPFARRDGTPYLEPHHLHQLSDQGLDHPAHVITLCPNCHKRVHHGADGAEYTLTSLQR